MGLYYSCMKNPRYKSSQNERFTAKCRKHYMFPATKRPIHKFPATKRPIHKTSQPQKFSKPCVNQPCANNNPKHVQENIVNPVLGLSLMTRRTTLVTVCTNFLTYCRTIDKIDVRLADVYSISFTAI
jgi:hypothetical protein